MLHTPLPQRSAMRWSTAWVGMLLPLVTYFAAWAFATGQQDPSGRAESRYLALTIAVAIAIQASLGPRRSRSLVATAGLALTALLTNGTGSTRGAVCMAILAAGIAYAAGERWRADRGRLSLGMAVAMSIAIQLFARPRLLLDPSSLTHVAMVLVVVPTVVGMCAAVLATGSGPRRALIASGTIAVLMPGWNGSVATLFLGLVGATWLRATNRRQDAQGVGRWLATVGGGLLVVLPLAWHGWIGAWPVGLAVSLAAIAWAAQRWPRSASNAVRIGFAAGISLAALATAWALGASGGSARLIPTGLLLFSLLPTLLLPLICGTADSSASGPAPTTDSARAYSLGNPARYAVLGLLPAASLLTLASRAENAPAGLAAVAALVVLSQPRRAPWIAIQGWWTGTVVALVSLLAAYPWARRDALHDAVALLKVQDLAAIAALVALVSTVGWLSGSRAGGPRWSRHFEDEQKARLLRWAGRAGLAATAIVLLTIRTPQPGAVFVPATALRAAEAVWRAPLPGPMAASRVVVDSIAANSLGLVPGSVVAKVQLLDSELETVAEWLLVGGRDTAEWAVERPDVAAALGGATPAPYAAVVVPHGAFFARWFRARFELETPVTNAAHVEIRLASNVPDGMQIVLQRVEVVP